MTPLVLITAPFLDTLTYGQINIVLLGVCYFAMVRCRNEWLFGMAVGLTAAIKLTPLALLLVPLLLWRWRSILAAGAAFLLPQVATLVLLPSATVSYWSDVVWDASRVGNVGYIDNLSLRGVLERLEAPMWAWILGIVAVVGFSGIAIWRNRRHDPQMLIGFAAGCMLLISPISWVHHFVWWPLIVAAWLIVDRQRATRRVLTVSAVLLALALTVSPKHLLVWLSVSVDSPAGQLLSAMPASLIFLGALFSSFASEEEEKNGRRRVGKDQADAHQHGGDLV